MIHVVIEGDSIASIAFAAGLAPDRIWNHPENAALKALRKDMHTLFPGDRVHVPDKKARLATGGTDQRHKFRRKGVPARLRLQLFRVETPRAGEEFELAVGGKTIRGKSDDEGRIEAWVAPDASAGVLTIGPDRAVIHLRIGHLDPMSEADGVRKRLANLGYIGARPPETTDEESMRDALRSFQRRFGLAETGAADVPTQALLARLHDRDELFPEDPRLARS